MQTWIVRLMTNRLAAGGLAIPPPLLSRTYQVLSDGTAAAMQARKVSYVAFPFPLRQLLVLLLGVFIVIAPIGIASFMSSLPLVGTVTRRAALERAAHEYARPRTCSPAAAASARVSRSPPERSPVSLSGSSPSLCASATRRSMRPPLRLRVPSASAPTTTS